MFFFPDTTIARILSYETKEIDTKHHRYFKTNSIQFSKLIHCMEHVLSHNTLTNEVRVIEGTIIEKTT